MSVLVLVGCGDNAGARLDAPVDTRLRVDSWTSEGFSDAAPFPIAPRVWLGGADLTIADPTTDVVITKPEIHDIIDIAVHGGYGFAIAGSPPAAYRVSDGGLERIVEARALVISGDTLWLATDTGVIKLDLVTLVADSIELGPQRDIAADGSRAWALGTDGSVHELAGSPLTETATSIHTNGLRLAAGSGQLSSVGFKQVCHLAQCWEQFGVESFATDGTYARAAGSDTLLPTGTTEHVRVALEGLGGTWAVGAGIDFDTVVLFSNTTPTFQELGSCSGATKTATEIIAGCESYFAHYSLSDGSRTLVNTTLGVTSNVYALAWEP